MKQFVGNSISGTSAIFISISFHFLYLTSIGIASFAQGVMGGEVRMACSIQPPNDIMFGEWSWYRHDNLIKQTVAVIEANKSVTGLNVASLNQPRGIGTTSPDGTLILQGLQLNDSGVYGCQLKSRNHIELIYIKLTVNGKFIMRMANNITVPCAQDHHDIVCSYIWQVIQ